MSLNLKRGQSQRLKPTNDITRVLNYDKEAVIQDLAAGVLSAGDIAIKYGISTGNVYTIRAVAKRKGILNSRGLKTTKMREEDEASVFNPEIRERIKDMRDQDLTTTEICKALNLLYEDVAKVMSRQSSKYGESLWKNLGQPVDNGGDNESLST